MIEKLTALYSPLDIEYNQAMSGEYKDLSIKSGDIEIIAGEKDGIVSGFWRPMVAFGDVVDLIKDWNIGGYLDFLVDGVLSPASIFLLNKGYRATPQYIRIIDLNNFLWKDIRKSYKSLINKFVDCFDDFDLFKKRHLDIKGQTRPEITFEIQKEMVIRKQAFVVNGTNSSGLFYYNKDWCYYASAVDGGEGLHGVLHRGIQRAKELGCKWFEVGELHFRGDEKLINISKFKRGFGGETKVRLLLQK